MLKDEAFERVRKYMNAPDVRMQRIRGYEGDRVGGRLGGRRGTFHDSFYEGYQGDLMQNALEEYTWSNLGWRLGVILGTATNRSLPRDDQKEIARVLFDMLSHLQAETIRHHDENPERKLEISSPEAAEEEGDAQKKR